MDVIRIEKDVGFVAQFDLATGLGDYLTWREATGLTTKPVKPAPGPPRTFRIWPIGKLDDLQKLTHDYGLAYETLLTNVPWIESTWRANDA